MRAWSELIGIKILPGKEIHIASPFLFYKLGFEFIIDLHRTRGGVSFYFHIGNLYTMFLSGRFLDFFSRW